MNSSLNIRVGSLEHTGKVDAGWVRDAYNRYQGASLPLLVVEAAHHESSVRFVHPPRGGRGSNRQWTAWEEHAVELWKRHDLNVNFSVESLTRFLADLQRTMTL